MSVSQMEELSGQDQTLFEEKRSVGAPQQSKRNPPARNTSRFWFERFLSVIQRQNPAIIDSTFLSQIAPSNEGKLLAQLKFLRVIDEQGKPTSVLPMLNMIGDEQKKAFQEIARTSYQDIFSEVKIDRAVPDDIVNFFIRKYAFTRDKAINASKFFLYLVDKGSIQVSPELGAFLSEKSSPVGNGQHFSGVQLPGPRVSERATKSPTKSLAAIYQSRAPVQRKGSREPVREMGQSMIQATISIRLDKDTPKEYWDRVLALLGERGAMVETQVNMNNVDQDQNVEVEEQRDYADGSSATVQ